MEVDVWQDLLICQRCRDVPFSVQANGISQRKTQVVAFDSDQLRCVLERHSGCELAALKLQDLDLRGIGDGCALPKVRR